MQQLVKLGVSEQIIADIVGRVALIQYHISIHSEIENDLNEGKPGYKDAITLDLLQRLSIADWRVAYTMAKDYHLKEHVRLRREFDDEFQLFDWSSISELKSDIIQDYIGANTVLMGAPAKPFNLVEQEAVRTTKVLKRAADNCLGDNEKDEQNQVVDESSTGCVF